MRKDILEKKLSRLNDKLTKLTERCKASEDVNEVRSLTEQLDDLKAEIAETQAELDAIEEERSAEPEVIETRNADIAKATVASFTAPEKRDAVDYGSMEYRQAFKDFMQRNVPIPAKYAKRSDGIGPANTQDVTAIIPTTIINELIKEVQGVYGNLYAKVRKLNVKGGVKFPIADLTASFKWITESTVSPRQDAGDIKEFVEFIYNMAEIRISQSLLSSIVALDLFEREITQLILEKFVEEMDYVIMHGTGVGQPTGILNDPRLLAKVAAGKNVITMTAADINDWTKWRKKLFAAIPLGSRNQQMEFIFPVSTVESYLLTMADANNNPIFRQAADLSEDGSRFFGRQVAFVEPNIIPDFDTANQGDVIGVYWKPTDYAINTQLSFGMKRYYDEDKNEFVNKAITIIDGKMLSLNNIWLIKKG